MSLSRFWWGWGVVTVTLATAMAPLALAQHGGGHISGHFGGASGGFHAGGFGAGGFHPSLGHMYGGLHGLNGGPTPHLSAGGLLGGDGHLPFGGSSWPGMRASQFHVPLRQLGTLPNPHLQAGGVLNQTRSPSPAISPPVSVTGPNVGLGPVTPYHYGYGYYYHPYYGYGIPYHGYWHRPRTYYYGYIYGLPYATAYNYTPAYYAYSYGQNFVPPAAAPTPEGPPPGSPDTDVGLSGDEYLKLALQAVRDRDYPEAIRQAGHAAIEMNEDARVHEVLWLALFCLQDFQGAAIEAHAVEQLGTRPSWAGVMTMASTPDDFTKALRALEAFMQRNQDSPFGSFLLGYQYLVIGSRDAAIPWLEQAARLAPDDPLVPRLLQSLTASAAGVEPPQPNTSIVPTTGPTAAAPAAGASPSSSAPPIPSPSRKD